jgi:hypothetical protein
VDQKNDAPTELVGHFATAVRNTYGAEHGRLARALGELLCLRPDLVDESFHELAQAVRTATAERRQYLSRLLGITVANTPTGLSTEEQTLINLFKNYSPNRLADPITSLVQLLTFDDYQQATEVLALRLRRSPATINQCPELIAVAKADIISPGSFLQAISAADEADHSGIDVRPYLELTEPTRRQLLTATAIVIDRLDTANQYPELRSQLDSFLTGSTELATETRLTVVEILMKLDSLAH